MQLKTDVHNRQLWWAAAFWIATAAMVFPGARYTAAQDDRGGDAIDVTQESDDLTDLILKSDGPSPSATVVKQCEDLFAEFDARPQVEGDWKITSSAGRTTLRGTNITFGNVEGGFKAQCASGSIVIVPSKSMIELHPQDQNLWQATMEDAGVSLHSAERILLYGATASTVVQGKSMQFVIQVKRTGASLAGTSTRLNLDSDGRLALFGAVQLTLGNRRFTAERAFIDTESTSSILRLARNVSVRSTQGDPQSAYELRCQSLTYDLVSGTMQTSDEP